MRAHTGSTLTAYKYTDQELDAETGLYNYDARLYDPVIGRFISPDTVIPDLYNPQSLNRYSYCLNNPLIYVDPSGHFEMGALSIGEGLGEAMAASVAAAFGLSSSDMGLTAQSWSSLSVMSAFGWSNVFNDYDSLKDLTEELDTPNVYGVGFITEYGEIQGMMKEFGVLYATDPTPGKPHFGGYVRVGTGFVGGKQTVVGPTASISEAKDISDLDGPAKSVGGSLPVAGHIMGLSLGGDYSWSSSGVRTFSINAEIGPSTPEAHGYGTITKTW